MSTEGDIFHHPSSSSYLYNIYASLHDLGIIAPNQQSGKKDLFWENCFVQSWCTHYTCSNFLDWTYGPNVSTFIGGWGKKQTKLSPYIGQLTTAWEQCTKLLLQSKFIDRHHDLEEAFYRLVSLKWSFHELSTYIATYHTALGSQEV